MMDLVVPKNVIHPAARRVALDCCRACRNCDLFARNGGACGGRAFSGTSGNSERPRDVQDSLPVCFGNVATGRYGSLARRRQLEPTDDETK